MTREKLSPYIKFVVSLGEFAPSVAVGTVIPFYFLFFMINVAHIDPGLAGTVLLVARLWDAINDPLVGNLSDKTRSVWGRRRPYMLLGAVPTGILFTLLWIVPPWGDLDRTLYYLIVYILFDTAFTVVTAPYSALTPELTLDADERTSLITWRMAVSIITGLAAALGMEAVLNLMPSLQVGFAVVGVVIGVVGIFPYLWIVAVVRERPEFQQEDGVSLLEGLRVVLTNRPFWLALATDALAWISVSLVAETFAFFLVCWGGMLAEDSPMMMGVILASAAAFLPLVIWLSNRLEKKWAYVICTATWMVVHVALWFVPRFTMIPIYVVAVIAGLGVSSAHVLPGAMSIDVLESVELESGRRQEGIFAGVSAFFRKLGFSVVGFAVGWVLKLTGYVADTADQTAGALTGLRVMITWVPLVLLCLAIWAAVAFPITRAVHARMVAELEARRATSSN